MALNAHIRALLEGFPDQLSDEQEAELRAVAETDPHVAALMEELEGLAATLDRPAPPEDPDLSGDFTLSELGRRRLDRELRALSDGGDLGTQKPANDAPRSSPWVWSVVAAAVLILGLGVLMRPAPEPPPTDLGTLTMRGEEDDVKVDLVVLGEAGPVATEGDRSIGAPVRFQAVASGPTSLAMLETHAGKTVMLYPVRGVQWSTEGGVSVLQPPGSAAEYRPAGPGPAQYVLVAAPGPIQVPAGPTSADDLGSLHPSARVVGRWDVNWTP